MSSLSERIRAALSRGSGSGAVTTKGEPHREDVLLRLQGDVPPGPSPAAVERGRHTLLSQLSEVHSGGTQKMPFANFALSPIAAVVAGSVLMLGSFAGVSAATGGPDVTEPVRDAVGVGDDDGDADDVDDGDVDDVDDGDEAGDDDSPASPGASPDADDDEGDESSDDGDDSSDDDSPPSPGATPDDDGDDSSDDDSPPSPGATPDDDSPDDDSPESPGATPDDDESDDSSDNSGPG